MYPCLQRRRGLYYIKKKQGRCSLGKNLNTQINAKKFSEKEAQGFWEIHIFTHLILTWVSNVLTYPDW